MMGRQARTPGNIYSYNNTSSWEEPSTVGTPQNTDNGHGSLNSSVSEASCQYYPVKGILDETRRKYLIAWEGDYSPTWEPKHFANREAVHVWKLKKEKRLVAADLYQSSRQPRRCKQTPQQPLGLSSGCSPGQSTVPDSQATTTSRNTFASLSTQRSRSRVQTQESSTTGSLFCPDASSLASQLSAGLATQSLQQASQSSNSSRRAPVQDLSQLTSAIRSGSLNSSSADPFATYKSLGSSSNFASQSQQTAPQGTASQHIPSSVPNSTLSDPLLHQPTPPSRYKESIFHRQAGILEIEETPPSRLLISQSTSGERSDTGTANSTTRNPAAYRPIETPLRQTRHQETIHTIPETDYRRQNTPTSRRRLLRQHSDPQYSPSVASPSSNPRGRSEAPRVLTEESTVCSETQGNKSSLPGQFDSSPEKDTTDLLGTMENPAPSASGDKESVDNSGRPSTGPDTTRRGSGTSLRNRLAAMRDAERASIQPLQNVSGTATPSSAGDIEPTAAPAHPATASPLSVRLEKEPVVHEKGAEPPQSSPLPFVAPQALHYDVEQASAVVPELTKGVETGQGETSDLDIPAVNLDVAEAMAAQPTSPPPIVKGLELGSFEFAVPLPMDSRVKDDYDRTLEDEGSNIPKFLDMPDQEALSEPRDNSIMTSLKQMIDQLSNICTHPDLNLADPPTINVNDFAREVSWAEYSSSKFLFLGYFIDAALDHALHIMVMVKNDRVLKLMETYFLGKGFSLRVTPSEMIFDRGPLSFGVSSVLNKRPFEPFKSPALIIAMDSSFSTDSELVQPLRKTDIPNHLVPVVRLVIANTAEHVQLCVPECSDIMKLRLLVKYTHIYQGNAGELQDDALGLQEDAEEIISYLTAESAIRKWPLPMIEELDVDMPEGKSPGSGPEELRSMTSSRQKRWLEGEEDEPINPSKRQRVTPLQDITHISDSMKGQTQDVNTEGRSEQAGKSNTELMQEMNALRSALHESEERQKRTEASLASLQHRYEKRHIQLHKTRQDLDVALEAAKKSESRIDKQKDEIMKLKDEKATLIKELEEARNTIKEGGGTAAELEKSQEELRKLTAENEKLQRTVNQERSQSEYTRQQYQNASSSAAQTALELRQREEEIEDLKSKASDEARRLKKLRCKNDSKADLARIEELEATLASRDQLLEKKEEELVEMKKNRHTTRATSLQPRSPKWGPTRPDSPGPPTFNSAPRASSALRFRAES